MSDQPTRLTVYGAAMDFAWGARIASAYLSRHGDDRRTKVRDCVLYVDPDDKRQTIVWGDRQHVRVRILPKEIPA